MKACYISLKMLKIFVNLIEVESNTKTLVLIKYKYAMASIINKIFSYL